MILVFVFSGIIIFIMLIIIVVIFSAIKIKVKLLEISNINKNLVKTKIGVKYDIKISFYLCSKIKIFSYNLKTGEIKNRNILKRLGIKDKSIKTIVKEKYNVKRIIKELKILNPKIEKLKLNILFDTEDVILTTILGIILSNLVTAICYKTIKKIDKNKYFYTIQPLYKNNNLINFSLSCIICIKMANIINIIYSILKKEVKIKDDRTSNTRDDDNSNGEHKGYGRCEHNYR